jgi:hypothetical protein
MLDLESELTALKPRRARSTWDGHEFVRGWGVFGLPFSSGHVLALRVFPENDFAPYRTVWHRDPEGRWSIFVDGPRLDTACPRYYGPACAHTGFAKIQVQWTGPTSLRVEMDAPRLSWTVSVGAPPWLAAANALEARLPRGSWRVGALLRAREFAAHRLMGLGALGLSGTMPSGHRGFLMPRRMYLVEGSEALLDGRTLGHPARLAHCPDLGGVTLPARGVLAVGEAHWEILDPEEYARTRAETDPARAQGARVEHARV